MILYYFSGDLFFQCVFTIGVRIYLSMRFYYSCRVFFDNAFLLFMWRFLYQGFFSISLRTSLPMLLFTIYVGISLPMLLYYLCGDVFVNASLLFPCGILCQFFFAISVGFLCQCGLSFSGDFFINAYLLFLWSLLYQCFFTISLETSLSMLLYYFCGDFLSIRRS